MLNLNVTNITNSGREIYVWHRIGKQLCLYKDKLFYPYFYQLSPAGLFKTIDGKRVNKVMCSRPSDLKNRRDENSYEADVPFCKRYIIDKVSFFGKTDVKYSFIDIEVLCKTLPNYLYPEQPISSISCNNSYTGEIKTFFLKDILDKDVQINGEDAEKELLDDFVKFIRQEQFDLLLGWNFIEFDWRYLQARYKKLFGCELAEMLSPIAQSRYLGSSIGELIPNLIPAGVSIMDFLEMYKKIYRTEPSYALDAICQKHLNETTYKKVDFSRLTDEIKEKNINDVRRMIDLEKKFKIIEYYDELRRMSTCEWSDVTWNSKMLDIILLREAKQKGIILPSKHYGEGTEVDEIGFEGAYRRCDTGLYKGLWKMDLASAYPMAIINFCLDISNIKNEGITINNVKFYQNDNALLPTIARKLISKKDILKIQLKSTNPETEEYKDLDIKYSAVKGIVNSLFGVTGLKIFRLFDYRIASSITFLIRDLLHYIEDELKKRSVKVIYMDTDSVFIDAPENPKDLCNELVKQWAKEKYNKDRIDITFDLEGQFEKLFVIALCHYKGYLKTKSGLKEEIKGIEAKRKDSSNFIRKFQNDLIEKIMNEVSQEEIVKWINEEKIRIKTLPLIDIGFPCRISKAAENYKSIPIFLRALQYTQELIPTFQKNTGDNFYWINVKSFGTSVRKSSRSKTNKETGEKELQSSEKEINKDVLVFDEDVQTHIKDLDWEKIIEKSIIMKCEAIFEALKWDLSLIKEIKESKKKIIKQTQELNEIDKQIEELQKKKKQLSEPKIAEEVSGKTRRISNSESEVRDLNSAPKISKRPAYTQEFIKAEIPKPTNYNNEINLKDLEIRQIDYSVAKPYIKENHYSHTIPASVKISLGFYYKNELKTAVIYGCPVGRCVTNWLQVNYENCLELVRLFSADGMPKNTESYCIAKSFQFLKTNYLQYKYLVSYADPNHGHCGYIYQATNWKYTGIQRRILKERKIFIDGIEVHPRNLSAKHGSNADDKLKEIYGDRLEIKGGLKKHVYIMCLGNHKECKEWYSKFTFQPYPKAQNNIIEGKAQ